jgi:hypothetical protein
MRQLSLKHGWLVPYAYNESPDPGRMIYAEPTHMTEPGWPKPAWSGEETVMQRESDVTDKQQCAAREWQWHIEAGRIG